MKYPTLIVSAALLALLVALTVWNAPASAADVQTNSANDAGSPKSDAPVERTIFPPEKTIQASMRMNGNTIKYNITFGTVPVVRDGQEIGEVGFTYYWVDKRPQGSRPVTFAMNGGPGASSAFLNFAAIGPKSVEFGRQGDSPSDSAMANDNPGSWIDFTDLVFLDPIGTGFSRSSLPMKEQVERFFSIDADVEYLSNAMQDWTVKYGRLSSKKYLVGESYSGFRAPAIARYLQTHDGIGLSGVIMLSPALDFHAFGALDVSPLYWVATLPSFSAAYYEQQGKELSPAQMHDVENYAGGEYLIDLMHENLDSGAAERIVSKVASFTGLSEDYVRKVGGRLEPTNTLREMYRNTAEVGSLYDATVKGYDPRPWSGINQADDPTANSSVITSAALDLYSRQAHRMPSWKYHTINNEVNASWEKGWVGTLDSELELREDLASDSKLKVMIVGGYTDLAVPYFESKIIASQIPQMGGTNRIVLSNYPGGHMFYSRISSRIAFKNDVLRTYELSASY